MNKYDAISGNQRLRLSAQNMAMAQSPVRSPMSLPAWQEATLVGGACATSDDWTGAVATGAINRHARPA
jgi:hypothetical protein